VEQVAVPGVIHCQQQTEDPVTVPAATGYEVGKSRRVVRTMVDNGGKGHGGVEAGEGREHENGEGEECCSEEGEEPFLLNTH